MIAEQLLTLSDGIFHIIRIVISHTFDSMSLKNSDADWHRNLTVSNAYRIRKSKINEQEIDMIQ